MRNWFSLGALLLVLAGCGAGREVVFGEGVWTTEPEREVVRERGAHLTFDLRGMEGQYGALPDSAALITNWEKLRGVKGLEAHARSVFKDLNIKKDTLLFFVPGEILVYRPHDFDPGRADYCLVPMDSVRDEFLHAGRIEGMTERVAERGIFRDLFFNRKRQRVICRDTYRDQENNWLSMAYIKESRTRYNADVAPRIWTSMLFDWTDPHHLFATAHRLDELEEVTKRNRRNASLAQKDGIALFGKLFEEGEFYNYYAAYLGEQLSDYYFEPARESMFRQMLATYFSFVGDTQGADSLWLLMRGNKVNEKPVEVVGTIDDLLEQTRHRQVVMFNEAHNAPGHRLLVTNLLDSLYGQGFRYLALETFYSDSLFAETGYLTENNGFYVREPYMGNLVRKAYQKGFKIIEYEASGRDREQKQAQNLYERTIGIEKDAKVLVHCGYQHIDTAWMAGYFQKISGIDPLTIDQTYGYYYGLGKATADSVCLIRPNPEDGYMKGADLFILNDLDVEKHTIALRIPEDIKHVCKVACVYGRAEFEALTARGKRPLPISARGTEGRSVVHLNIEDKDVVILFLDEYGEVVKSVNWR